MKRTQSGIMTLTLLMLLTAMLMISMLFSDDILRLHSAIASQRADYLSKDLVLQKMATETAERACDNVDNATNGSAVKIPVVLQNQGDEIKHYQWCKRYALFSQAPKVGVNQGTFEQFINAQNLPRFEPHFQLPPAILPKDKGNYLYWFDKTQTEWSLNGNIYAVVVAEGDLHISGKGKISGAVITRGNLTKEDSVTLAYRKATVTNIVQRYSQWEREERSWYDFKQE